MGRLSELDTIERQAVESYPTAAEANHMDVVRGWVASLEESKARQAGASPAIPFWHPDLPEIRVGQIGMGERMHRWAQYKAPFPSSLGGVLWLPLRG